MKVLVITVALPDSHARSGNALRMAPLVRQVDSLRQRGVDVEVFEVKGVPKLKYVMAAARLLRRAKAFDVIHAHYGFCGWVGRLQHSAPLVVTLLGSDLLARNGMNGRTSWRSRLECWTTKRLSRVADSVIVMSEEMARAADCENVRVIPHGIDLNLFRPMPVQSSRQRLGWPAERRYVLFPGNPALGVKNFPLAQAAVDMLRSDVPFTIDLVPLWGVAPQEVPIYMCAADALLMTSHWEGSPNVVKEAMACNLPVVSVPVGDVAWLLQEVSPSAICERDPKALAEALRRILLNRTRSHGREAILRRELDSDSVAAKIEHVYREVLTHNAKWSLPEVNA